MKQIRIYTAFYVYIYRVLCLVDMCKGHLLIEFYKYYVYGSILEAAETHPYQHLR